MSWIFRLMSNTLIISGPLLLSIFLSIIVFSSMGFDRKIFSFTLLFSVLNRLISYNDIIYRILKYILYKTKYKFNKSCASETRIIYYSNLFENLADSR